MRSRIAEMMAASNCARDSSGTRPRFTTAATTGRIRWWTILSAKTRKRKRKQEPDMHVHIKEDRHLDAPVPRAAFRDRQDQQWQPRNKRQDDHAPRHQFQHNAA